MSEEHKETVSVDPATSEAFISMATILYEGPAQAIAGLAFAMASISLTHCRTDNREATKAECLRIVSEIYDHVTAYNPEGKLQ